MTPTPNNKRPGNGNSPRPENKRIMRPQGMNNPRPQGTGNPHPQGTGNPRPQRMNNPHPQSRDAYNRKEISLGEAVLMVLKDRIRNFRLGFSIDLEDLLHGTVCGVLIVITVLMQTTFFARFSLFGAVPDVMLILAVAVGMSEGEKYGAVTGLVGSFLLRCLGGAPGIDLSPVLYCFAGYFAGILAFDYFSNTVAVKAMFTGGACILRAIFSTVNAEILLRAPLLMTLTDIVLPELFSTAIVSPVIFFAAWLAFRKFHKSRAERTGA